MIVGRQHDGLLDEAGGNAGRARRPRSATWHPAATPSCQPWKWPTKRITFGLPVKARASRSARCEASVPEPVKRTLSAHGHQAVDQLGPPHLELVGGAPVRAARHLPLDGLDHGGVAVAQQQRAVAAEVVDVLVAVDVPLAGARRAGGIDRIGQQRAAVVGEAGGQHLAGLP